MDSDAQCTDYCTNNEMSIDEIRGMSDAPILLVNLLLFVILFIAFAFH